MVGGPSPVHQPGTRGVGSSPPLALTQRGNFSPAVRDVASLPALRVAPGAHSSRRKGRRSRVSTGPASSGSALSTPTTGPAREGGRSPVRTRWTAPDSPDRRSNMGAAPVAGQRIEADQADLLVPHQSDQQVANEFCELRCAPFEFFTCRLVPVMQELASKIVEALRPLRVGVV